MQFIDSDPATALADFNTSTGDAVITIGAGVTVVMYDDEPLPPSGTGWLEICKDGAWLDKWTQDPDVHGSFHFDVTDAAGATYSKDVLVGQCSEPFQVAAGISEVVEGPTPGYDLVDVATIPGDRLLTANLINRTADVEVPASDSSNDETQVHFFNQTQRGQLKICKTLGPGSSDLIGEDFYFSVHRDGAPDVTGIEITAQASTQCVIVGYFPIGSTVDVEENIEVKGFDQIDPTRGDFIDTSGEGEITIAPGINTKTITNTAAGLLEVCKARVDFGRTPEGLPSPAAQPTFRFRIDAGTPFTVQAGKCSLPKRVSVGNHTVTELGSTTGFPAGGTTDPFELNPTAPGNGITVNPADREVSRNLNLRMVTVNVPYGPNGETLVTFYNRIKLGTLKVCKQIPATSQDSLGGKPFTYTATIVNANPPRVFHLGPIVPGECTFYVGPIPILNAFGTPVVITVDEDGATTSTTFEVTSITCTGCALFASFPATGEGQLILGPGVNAVTFTNRAKDP